MKIEAGNSDGLTEATNAFMSNVTETMGVADFYSLHVMKICSGTITADEKWVIDKCSNYSTALNGKLSGQELSLARESGAKS